MNTLNVSLYRFLGTSLGLLNKGMTPIIFARRIALAIRR
jgi:hypothetical protein